MSFELADEDPDERNPTMNTTTKTPTTMLLEALQAAKIEAADGSDPGLNGLEPNELIVFVGGRALRVVVEDVTAEFNADEDALDAELAADAAKRGMIRGMNPTLSELLDRLVQAARDDAKHDDACAEGYYRGNDADSKRDFERIQRELEEARSAIVTHVAEARAPTDARGKRIALRHCEHCGRVYAETTDAGTEDCTCGAELYPVARLLAIGVELIAGDDTPIRTGSRWPHGCSRERWQEFFNHGVVTEAEFVGQWGEPPQPAPVPELAELMTAAARKLAAAKPLTDDELAELDELGARIIVKLAADNQLTDAKLAELEQAVAARHAHTTERFPPGSLAVANAVVARRARLDKLAAVHVDPDPSDNGTDPDRRRAK